MQPFRLARAPWFIATLLAVLLAACMPVQPPTQGQTADQAAATPADGATQSDGNFPVTINNCGLTTTYTEAPKAAVSMNQAATEIMLSLGLQGSMVGTAYLDDAVAPDLQAAYESVPVLSAEYPSKEVLLDKGADFIYGSYSSVFEDEAAGLRDELASLGIKSYLSVPSCDDKGLRPDTVTFDTLFNEILDVGRIFGVEDRAQALVDKKQETLNQVQTTIGDVEEPVTVFWYDSETDAPSSGACCGAPAMIMDAVGAQNIFSDTAGNWATTTWEEVIARNPQAIVLADASWSTAKEKMDFLLSDPRFASIDAVKNKRFVTIPFSWTSLGVHNDEAVVALAKGLYPDKFDKAEISGPLNDPVDLSAFPVTIDNCGIPITYAAPPQRAVSMNQSTTETMLKLGLQNQMVGTGNLVDTILPELQSAYQAVPVLADKYPSQELILAAQPDFVYGAFRGAFADEAAGSRASLLGMGINSYVSPLFCEDKNVQAKQATFDLLFGEIRDIGHIFGVDARAEKLVSQMQTELNDVEQKVGTPAQPVKVLWYDSNIKEPFVGVCCGAPAMLMKAAGAENVFADTPGTWATVDWESIVDRNPDAIVFVQSAWSTVPAQEDYLLKDPTFASIPAVKNHRFIVLPFSATTLGIRNADEVAALAKGLYPEKFQ